MSSQSLLNKKATVAMAPAHMIGMLMWPAMVVAAQDPTQSVRDVEPKLGTFTAQFTERHPLSAVKKQVERFQWSGPRVTYEYDIAEESFENERRQP